MNRNNYYTSIRQHAQSVPQQEVCGFLFYDRKGSLQAFPCQNVSEDPSKHFAISMQDQMEARKTNDLAAYYHSHWDEDEAFSPRDIAMSNNACIPVFCYSLHTDRFNLHRPLCAMPRYEGRHFVLGFQDCATVVTDFMSKEFGVHLPYFERPPEILEAGFPGLFSYLLAHGFERVGIDGLQRGDILAFSIRSRNASCANHVGIYLKENTFLHQLAELESSVSPLTENWLKKLVFAFRLKR